MKLFISRSFFFISCIGVALGDEQPGSLFSHRSYNQKLAAAAQTKTDDGVFHYPNVRRDESQKDEYFGRTVADPYRWLEDPDSPETLEFVIAQNNLTIPYVHAAEGRDRIQEKLKELYNHDQFGTPVRRKNRYFFFNKNGLQNQQVLYVQDGIDGKPRVLLDPNTLSTDGTTSITSGVASKCGEIYAYGLSSKGSDWTTVHFRNVTSGEDFPEVLKQSKWPGIEWTHDNRGIFYSRYPDASTNADGSETTINENAKIYYHFVGTPQSSDQIIVEFPEYPKRTMSAEITDDGKYLVVSVQEDLKHNLIYYTKMEDLIQTKFRTKPILNTLVGKMNGEYLYFASKDNIMYFYTNKEAPNYRVVGIYLDNPDEKYWSVLIPENPTDVLNRLVRVNKDQIVTDYMHDVKSILQLRRFSDGSLIKDFNVEVGSVQTLTGNWDEAEFFFRFESYLSPGRIYIVDVTNINNPESIEPKLFRETSLVGFDASQYTTSQVFFTSKDGTKVPMFIVHKKNIKLDGSAPTLLYGYGGFNINLQPSFSESRIAFIQLFNGVVAIANIRGGGEYGAKWHEAGTLLEKQNTFDDFQAAAQYLVDKKYTTTSKLTIQGGSNGGLLVGACVNQRPDLFGAAFAQVGVLDMLRYHKFTIGHAWASDYGTSDDKINFDNLIKYSPVHNVRVPSDPNVQYPSVLITTGDHDDRVVPLHSFKFIAELQYTVGRNARQSNPLMILIERNAGHGAGKPTSKKISELTDMYSFLVQSLGLTVQK